MARETIEQMTARLTKEDEAKEEIFHKRLKEIKADNSRWRAEKVKKERAEEREREKLHEDLRLKRERRWRTHPPHA